jgi:PhoPQ-activated pathogenicity-related protein
MRLRAPLATPARAFVWLLAGLSILPLVQAGNTWSVQTALDKYVHAPDPAYKWSVANTVNGEGYTAYMIDLTSQAWNTPVASDVKVWKHWMIVIKPTAVKHTTGFLFITGGSNGQKAPDKVDPSFADMAVTTGTVVAELRQVPNQPINFEDAKLKNMVEDQFIAYTWDKFLRTGKDIWPARLPMTKSAVKAMDALQEFTATEQGGNKKLTGFVVSGGSKRGWTTWTTAAVDKRVVAIEPIVIDLLNIRPSFEHHWRAYGFWAPAVGDYERAGVMDWSDTKEYMDLIKIVEPFEYRERLTMPKFLINSAGDQFFLPDSSQFYFKELQGEKYLRYVPNSDHSLRGTDVRESMTAYYDMILNKKARPKLSWKYEKDGTMVATTDKEPKEVLLWQATNPTARDFRLEKIGKAYKSSPVTATKKGVYEAKIAEPGSGWTAYFLEFTYDTGGKYPLKITTEVKVTPDKYPFGPPKYKGKPADATGN